MECTIILAGGCIYCLTSGNKNKNKNKIEMVLIIGKVPVEMTYTKHT
jgi:hypothetical protein